VSERMGEALKQENRLKENISKIKNKLIVISGKGGVGKTTVAVNLAYGLAIKGYKVGILDVDIHGPNVPKMLGIEEKRLAESEGMIEPVFVLPNLKAVSIALLMGNSDQPVVWRGPLKMMAIKQFLSDVNWGSLDYLIVDSPPGTGDEPLSVCQLIHEVNGAIVVTTSQAVAVMDARKSILFAKGLKVPVVGLIENMSSFLCPHCGERIDLFGTGGGENSAHNLGVPFLGRILFDTDVVKFADSGRPFVSLNENMAAVRAMAGIINNIIDFLKNNER